ncbi:MAG: sodium:solute symporter family protein [Negativicoccus succinicivorans]|uniref:sodium:solute symporter family protein n=1 Tax=Negativicoccus succinicivorans TaxID=620903 RepID=UPI0026ED5F3B|nr:sodium:solute symporter family protein [Negativicoccus succinicivorans]MBS5887790.1 sodium:solute symporter family protein [Negativicoccus succinicivorans]
MSSFTVWHWGGIFLAFAAVFITIFATAQKSSLENFSVGGRASGPWLVAGALVGTIVGGSATVGTAQGAVSAGFSAWWFTFGSTLGFILLGKVYAGPLRASGLKTIAEYIAARYGKMAGMATSIVSVLGIFFSLVASGLAGIHFMQILFPVSELTGTVLLLVIVVLYVLAGGIRGTAVSGIVKTVLLYTTLIIAGVYAWRGLAQLPAATVWHADWLWPQGGSGWRMFATNCLSVIIGVAVTQSYAQALYSARDAETAARGSYLAAALCMPVGLPLILIGIHTHFMTPSIDAVTALPMFMQMHLPSLLAGLGIGAILLSIIGSIAGLSLGAATSIAVDIFESGFGVKGQKRLLFILQAALIMLVLAAFSVSLYRYHSQILYWNFLSFSLRGAGVFLPFLLAIYAKGPTSEKSTTANILFSTLIAVLSIGNDTFTLNPLYVGIGTSACWLLVETIWRRIDRH